MLSWSKTSAARASAAPGPARCRETYQRYAGVFYRQALLEPGDPASAGSVVGDAIVNERALAAMPGRRPDPGALRLVLAGGLRHLRRTRGAGDPPALRSRGHAGTWREHAGVMDTRRVRVGCEFGYVSAVDTPAVFQVEPLDAAPVSLVRREWSTEPDARIRRYADLYGNPCTQPLLPARHARRRSLVPVRRHAPGLPRVQAICEHVNGHLISSTAVRRGAERRPTSTPPGLGVCRDFTHLAISFCRALNIPARYVFGYLPEMDVPPDPAPMDFAAWMEVWLGDRWWTFDPRNNRRRKGRILIGRGRDASDVAMVTTFGAPLLESMTVHAREEPE